MGQVQNKYHVTNDGDIFLVSPDGSVSRIGNITQLSIKSLESRQGKGKIITIFILSILLIFVTIGLAKYYFSYENERRISWNLFEQVKNIIPNGNENVWSDGNSIYVGDKTLEEFFTFSTEIDKPSSKGYSIFSSHSRIYCNGIYPYDSDGDNAKFFSCNLSSINKNHFSIDFEFNPQKSGTDVLMLSDSYRILGIFLANDGSIGITTDNDRHYYNTPYKYTLNKWNSLCIEYNNGDLYINSFKIPIVIENLYEGDNNLSSINYSCGRAFTGEISNINVISY